MSAPADGLEMGLIVFTKILAMFVVLATGFLLRRARVLDEAITATMSRLLTDLIFPALVVSQLVDLVDWQTLRESVSVFVLGAGILLFGGAAAFLLARVALPPEERRTGAFLMAIPNWIFMPLPIVTVLYGPPGVRALLLINVSMQLLLWTGGIWLLQRGAGGSHPLTQLRSNRGLQATALALVLGVLVPHTASLPDTVAVHTAVKLGRALVEGVGMLGSLTVPLILLAVGSQLAGLAAHQRTSPRLLATVVAGRLLVLPMLSVIALTLLRRAGWGGSAVVCSVALVILTMPIAVTCGAFLERFGGDVALGARSIFVSTVWSIVTVPTLVVLVERCWAAP